MVQLAASCSKELWLERAEVKFLFQQADLWPGRYAYRHVQPAGRHNALRQQE